MSYDIPLHALTPPLVVTITDTVPINVSDVDLMVYDENGALIFTDTAPAVNASNPLAVVVTHTWLAGQTDVAGTYGVQVNAGGLYPSAGPLTFTIGMGTLAGYCTRAQAIAAGATGTNQEIDDAIVQARKRIDRYCGDAFAPTRMELVTNIRADGTALLQRTLRLVESVTPVGGSSPIAAGAYTATSSRTPGQVDALAFGWGSQGAGDPIIAGAEPWNGGWANLIGNLRTGQIQVVGSFGWDEPPPEIVAANAQLASAIRLGGATGPDVDDEGNVVKVTVAGADATRGVSTGVAAIDEQIAHLRRAGIRLGY